jgi:two-component system response regulator HydG
MGRGRFAVMVVDDDVSMRNLLQDYLTSKGARVTKHSSGDAALAAIDADAVDVVVVDKEMPGMNGLDVVSDLRRRRPGLPVIVITAFGGAAIASETVARGAAHYFEKPFRMSALFAAIMSAVSDSRRQAGAQTATSSPERAY